MPIHDYRCANCGYEIEVMHPVHGHGPSICVKCGGPMKRAFGAPAVHFKGSGWARKERSDSAQPTRSTATETDKASGAGPESTAAPGGTAAADSAAKEPD